MSAAPQSVSWAGQSLIKFGELTAHDGSTGNVLWASVMAIQAHAANNNIVFLAGVILSQSRDAKAPGVLDDLRPHL